MKPNRMKNTLTIAVFLPCFLHGQTSFGDASLSTITGTISAEQPIAGPTLVWAMPLQILENGRIVGPSKQAIFAASGKVEKNTATDGSYSLSLAAGPYTIFAFADTNRNGRWDPVVPEPFGWYSTKPSGRFDIVQIKEKDLNAFDFTLRAPRHFSGKPCSAPGGTLRQVKGYTVLQLTGNAHDRGYAHGNLVAPQIIDFFRFYILEDKMRSAQEYENGFAKFLHSHFDYPTPFVTECEAVLEGMQASGESLLIPELDRDFSLTDLYAINSYIETRAMRSSCTQFAAWGPRTESTDVDGGMITGRNMDGEVDIRKVTVSHFLLFAVDPSEPEQKRYVSMMWPGFVATISGMNEDGFYTMENAGLTGPGAVVDRLVPFSWTMREALAKLGADTTPESLQSFVDTYDNSAGGVCGPGCITLFAVPYRGQSHPAFVLEGDRFGDSIRVAGSVRPRIANALVLSNHHRQYGVTDAKPDLVFDKAPSFSSLWRYEAGMHKLEAWHRIDRRIGTKDMRELLQTAGHGTTEYAIITRPNQLEIDVSIASMKPELWDAPYRRWTTFKFDEFFSKTGESQ